MIIFDAVTKIYGPRDVLRDVSFSINPGERVGLVGPNGAGKSTIFRLIVGEEDYEGGSVIVPKALRIGYLRQQLPDDASDTPVLDFVLRGLSEVLDLEKEIHRLQDSLAATPEAERPAVLHRLGDLQHEFEHRDGYTAHSRAEAALGGLGFPVERLGDPLGEFSGGWQMRAQLAQTLVSLPDILLLDEPSNYLDLPAVDWLQRFLFAFPGTLLLISHDRHLLRTLAKDILDIRHAKVARYSNGYDAYHVEREARFGQQEARLKNLQRRRDELERFVTRFRAQASKASLVQSRIKMLEKMEPLPDIDPDDVSLLIRIPPPPHSGHELMRLEGAGHRYGDAPWLFRHLDLRLERGDRLALVGYNGMGKSTLLKILAAVFPAAEGKRVLGHQAIVGYQSQEFADTMPAEQSAYRVIKDASPAGMGEQQVRTLLGGFGFKGEDVEKPTGVLSGGEKIRLAFARIFVNPPNLLVLDEPTTHLDIAGREALENALREYQGTVVLVSHDIEFTRNVATGILAITPGGVYRCPGDYDYFVEKTGGLQALAEGHPPVLTESAAPALGGKERREAQKAIRRLETQVERLEASIAKLESEQAEGSRLLQGGDVENYAALQKRLGEIAGRIQSETREWVKLGEELDGLREKVG